MSRNNDVFKVMFLPDAAANVAADEVGDLVAGEWGLFDYDTGLTVSALDAAIAASLPTNFFFAYVGDGTLGTLNEIYTSSGTHIQAKQLKYLTINNDSAVQAQQITVDNYVGVQSGADATNYDYGLKLDFRGNSEVYQRYGANQASKFFMGSTKCVGNAGAAEDAGAEVVAQWAEAIAGDSDQFIEIAVTGTGITGGVTYTPTGVPGSVGQWQANSSDVTEAVALAAIRGYTTGSGDLSLVVHVGAGTYEAFSSMYNFCNVNPKYFKQRQIKAIASLVGSDCLWADIAETQAMVYGEGYGYDVNDLEYLAGGFTGKPGVYRQSTLNGLAFMNVEFIAVKTTQYTICALSYDQFSVGGWQEYLNNLSTYFILVATPTDTDGYPQRVLAAIAAKTGIPVTTTGG